MEGGHGAAPPITQGGVSMTRDPVCGAEVAEGEGGLTAEYAERRYSFCSSECLETFNREPDLFTAGPELATRANRDLDAPPMPGPGAHAIHEEASTDAGPG